MNLKERISQRIGMDAISMILSFVQGNDLRKQELYDLCFDPNDKISYQAAWVMTHYSSLENRWLYAKQDELINEVICCEHDGRRRLLLTILYRQPFIEPLRADFLDFCMEGILSRREPLAIQSLCMKLAYAMCCATPELKDELRLTLELLDGDLSPAIRSAKNSILKAMAKGSSLQVF